MGEIELLSVAQFAGEVVVNFVVNAAADLCAGCVVALLAAMLAWRVGKRLNLFEQAEERKQRLARESHRASQWMRLLKDEVSTLVEMIPQWRKALLSTSWGKVFNISTPIWNLADRSGEVAKLVEPELVGDLSKLYNALGDVKTWLALIAESWMIGEDQVVNPGAKRQALVGMAVQGLDKARAATDGLEKRIEGEITRLSRTAARLGVHLPDEEEVGADGAQ